MLYSILSSRTNPKDKSGKSPERDIMLDLS